MPVTPIYGLPYPSLSDPPDGPDQIQALADAVETELDRIDSSVAENAILLAGTPTTRVSDSSAFTSETVLDTITVPLVSGRRYKVVWDGQMRTTVSGDRATGQLRETNIAGTLMQSRQVGLTVSGTSFHLYLEAFFTATSTGNKTFVATGLRSGGTGSITSSALATVPTVLYVEKS